MSSFGFFKKSGGYRVLFVVDRYFETPCDQLVLLSVLDRLVLIVPAASVAIS